MLELVFYIALGYLAFLSIRFGVRLFAKERSAAKALGQKLVKDAEKLADETEAWLKARLKRGGS